MSAERRTVDSVRASRDGHEFHEVWTARKAMELLFPDRELVGIAVEGLHPMEQGRASREVVDIADLVLYYGDSPTFVGAHKTTITQVKYSIRKAEDQFRASDAKKTINKFAAAFRDFRAEYSPEKVRDRLDFLVVTNRPIYPHLQEAVAAIATGSPTSGKTLAQVKQFTAASGLEGRALAVFATKCRFIGRLSHLPVAKQELVGSLISWSPGSDLQARARLGDLKQMVRDKAGQAGAGRNVITRPDVLYALGVPDEEELLPAPAALVDIGEVVQREQLTEVVTLIRELPEPLLLHAPGGIGKTVFLESVARALQDQFETVFFDCFGGGAYRSPEDARHLPQHALVHIANTLAFDGLCDPILPGGSDVPSLLRAFRRRLEQAAKTVDSIVRGRGIALFIDAADNAIQQAEDRSEPDFPTVLLKSLSNRPIPGVRVIMSSRTHRCPPESVGYRPFELLPFTYRETTALLRARLGRVTESEVRVALARSGGNPRVIDYLIEDGERRVLDDSEIDQRVELDDLIQERISEALAVAIRRGFNTDDINTFLAGLVVLPPPIPVDEYAGALSMGASEVESFASDLRPLLERTNQGLMFRDEPTETLVRERYTTLPDILDRVADRLFDQQGTSVYAARALPGLLQQLEAGERLFALAFDERIPKDIKTTIGKRSVRYARLKAATLHAAREGEFDHLTQLLVELSTVTAVDHRGIDYIVSNPDLVVLAKDSDALRRLFETRTGWSGSRHARLTIANVLGEDVDEAYRHLHSLDDWIRHYFGLDSAERHAEESPDRLDIAAMPFALTALDQGEHAAAFMRQWRPWYAFEVCNHVIRLSVLGQRLGIQGPRKLDRFVGSLKGDLGCLAAALSFAELARSKKLDLVDLLARACRQNNDLDLHEFSLGAPAFRLQDGLRKAAAIALSLGCKGEALVISLRAPHRRPGLWSFRDAYHHPEEVFPFIFRKALEAAAKGIDVHERDILPSQLRQVCSRIPKRISGKDFRDKAKKTLARVGSSGNATLSYNERQSAERFLDGRLEPLLALTKALSRVLAAGADSVDGKFSDLLNTWEAASRSRDPRSAEELDAFFFRLGLECAVFAFWARDSIERGSVTRLLRIAQTQWVSPERSARLVSIMAHRPDQATLAGELASKTRRLIEAETDVAHRASLFAALSRAIAPASAEEAAAYFRVGLEQLEAIGAGDYEFTNELLSVAASMAGEELEARDFHTLTNICELNMPEEPEKFPWSDFARGLSRAAGVRGLAKLSRWDDRDRVQLSCSLLPYLTALVEHGKLKPIDAVAMNRLASPVELYGFGTDVFAAAVAEHGGTPEAMAELASQFEANNRGCWIPSAAEALANFLDQSHGAQSEPGADLRAAHERSVTIVQEKNQRQNQTQMPSKSWAPNSEGEELDGRVQLQEVIATTDPTDDVSLEKAVEGISALPYPYDGIAKLFAGVRDGVPFDARIGYVQRICALSGIELATKLDEMTACQEVWAGSSAALREAYAAQAEPLLQQHAEEFLGFGRLSRHRLREFSELTGISIPTLALKLIQVYATPGRDVPGSVWLSLASVVCPVATSGRGQIALTRLLRTDAAKLADSVQDGPWKMGLYPADDGLDAMAGLIWRRFGSPHAAARWQAAQCLRSFARFDRWEVIDAVVTGAEDDHAGQFQANELPFYFLHARLWLLIALARLALDHPEQVASYDELLLSHVREGPRRHVLMRHFAARALIACIDQGALSVPGSVEESLLTVDCSKHDRIEDKLRQNGGFYSGRPESAPEPRFNFYLDYDFAKHDVDNLGRVFGRPMWQLRDMLAEIVHDLDPGVNSMHQDGGRESPYRHRMHGMKPEYHTYGQQIGWHALFMMAATLLRDCPVTQDWWYEDDPWGEWLRRYVLTRQDGLWLSDGMDRRPLRTIVNLLERTTEGLRITGDRSKLLNLAWLSDAVGSEFMVEGTWTSCDGISVSISSALAARPSSAQLAQRLTEEEPFFVWLPSLVEGDDGSEYIDEKLDELEPWVVLPPRDAALDEHDPLGAPVANARPRIAADLAARLSIRPRDPFGRTWIDNHERVGLRSLSWGFENRSFHVETSNSGTALLASDWLLKKVLGATERHLIVLIRLQRYEPSRAGADARFSHTIAVARIAQDLSLKYFRGPVDHVQKTLS